MADLTDLGNVIRGGERIVFFGGAGVSTESGIPDFRSADGLYSQQTGETYPPEFMLSHTAWETIPEEFYTFYRTNLIWPEARPNPAHQAMAWLEERGRSLGVITQNIDGLHQMAGSTRVVELHGSVHRNYCVRCHSFFDVDFILDSNQVPTCECGGTVKPDVVLYEEGLSSEAINTAITMIQQADVLVVCGTSLTVYPAAGLINYFRGDSLVLINRDPTGYDGQASIIVHDAVGKVLDQIVTSMKADERY